MTAGWWFISRTFNLLIKTDSSTFYFSKITYNEYDKIVIKTLRRQKKISDEFN